VSAWVLARDLPAIAQGAADPLARAGAELVAEAYLYPVDSLVLSPAGELLDHMCANDLMDGNGTRRYRELLESALQVRSDD